jgi:hypothetical protein
MKKDKLGEKKINQIKPLMNSGNYMYHVLQH